MKSKTSTGRRDFMLAAGLAAAAATGFVASRSGVAAPRARKKDAQSDGYRASSPHIQKYYKTTEV